MVDGSALTPMTLPSPAFTRSPRWPCWRRVGALAPRACSHTWVPPRSPERHLPPCRRAGLLAGWALPYPAPILDMLMAISTIYLPCWPLSALSPHCHGQHRRPPESPPRSASSVPLYVPVLLAPSAPRQVGTVQPTNTFSLWTPNPSSLPSCPRCPAYPAWIPTHGHDFRLPARSDTR